MGFIQLYPSCWGNNLPLASSSWDALTWTLYREGNTLDELMRMLCDIYGQHCEPRIPVGRRDKDGPERRLPTELDRDSMLWIRLSDSTSSYIMWWVMSCFGWWNRKNGWRLGSGAGIGKSKTITFFQTIFLRTWSSSICQKGTVDGHDSSTLQAPPAKFILIPQCS